MKRAGPRSAGIGAFVLGAVTALLTLKLFSPNLQRSPGGRVAEGEDAGRGHPGAPPSAEATAAGYETHDASARSLVTTMAIFAVATFVSIGLMLLLLGVWHRADAVREAGYTNVQRMNTPPPEPRLQAHPLEDIALEQSRETAALRGYARLDATTARIPIERAMALVAGHPLDTPAQAAAPLDGTK